MTQSLSTCWTVIRGAAAGRAADRDEFARRYNPVIRAYLAARWRCSPCWQHLDDAIQEVFVVCFQPDGVIERADPSHVGGFRAFLYGVVRNVALRVEERRARERSHRPPVEVPLERLADNDTDLARVFDRAWARALLREAAMRQMDRAPDEAARQRVELLRLRFHEGLPIREIARRWNAEPAVMHRDYAKARQEFRAALLEVVAFHHPNETNVEQVCRELTTLLE
jgi:RNA polymerase sigma-70 factor (ECF subfamily)